MTRSRRASLALSALMFVVLLGEPALAAARIRGVLDDGGRWRPRRVSIDRGDRVVWRAVEGDHNVRAYGGNWSFSRALPEGETVSRRFPDRGRFRFRCTFHSTFIDGVCDGMCGRIRVG